MARNNSQPLKRRGGGNDNKKTLIIVAAIAVLALLGYFIYKSLLPSAKSWDGQVFQVSEVNEDGSIVLTNGMTVDLLGVSANNEGKNWMRTNLVGKSVILTANSNDTQKTYSDATKTRVKAYVTVDGSQEYTKLNRYLLSKEYASFSPNFCSDSATVFKQIAEGGIKPGESGSVGGTTPTGKLMTKQELFDYMAPATFLISTPSGGGTGFFINEKGVALTNYHVLKGYVTHPEYCKVFLSDKKGNINEDRDRPILRNIKWDSDQDWCICVISLDPGEYSHYLNLAKQQARRGDDVAVLGHTQGIPNTFSTGIISNIHDEAGVIQFTAEINHGNSGGPVCNMYGDVVGIATAMLGRSDGTAETGNINWGVDIMKIREVLDELDDVPNYGGK